MEVSSTSNNATSSVLITNDDNQDDINITDAPVTLAITNGEDMSNLKSSAGVGDCDLNTATVPYGPIISPHFYQSDSVTFSKDVRDSKAVHGSSGLYNLGNTCYMNSGIQSLISCAPLIKFFSERYTLSEANHHTLTYHFYILLCKMWSGQFSVVHPRTFKDFLGLYHSQFEDYRQHDCQEFLAFLLDTLHEQLNMSSLSNNAFSATPILDKDDVVSDTPSVSSLPSTSAVLCKVAEGTESVTASSVSPAGVEGSNEKTHLCEDGKIDNVKEKGEESADFAVVSATSSSPQSLGECSESGKISSPGYCHFEAESSGKNTANAGVEEVCMSSSSSSVEDNHQCANKDTDLAEKSDCDYISSSCPALRRYTSRSNLDDVSSSDMGLSVKPSLKRVSSDSGVTASGLVFFSEDSNQSSISVHSTDSEQSSAFKKLKIDSLEINKNFNCNNNSQKDFVSSSSDCKTENYLKIRNEKVDSIIKSNEAIAASTACVSSTLHKTVNIGGNGIPVCPEETLESDKDMPNLEDFYRKETKTLNTNVLVTDHIQEITSDSEKFAKVDNRNRPPSKEINLLQEAFGEEDKVDKVLISQHFGLKDTNLLAQASSSAKPTKSNAKALNNSCEEEELTCSSLVKLAEADEVLEEKALVSPLKNVSDGASLIKLDEVEKNVQMQAYSKFNTTPARSNIRTDLIDADPKEEKSIDLDEADEEESSDEEVVEKTTHSHCSNVDNCSSIPNCLRHCSSSEITMANQAWADYKAKNDSIVVSTFQGQFRSTVVCSECNHVSVTYEPFMYLSLPIPHAMDQQLCVTYISMSKPPVRYLLNLLRTDKMGTAKKKLKDVLSQTEGGDIIMAEMLDMHVSRILDDSILLKYVNTVNRKIYAFDVVNALNAIGNGGGESFSNQLLNNHDENSMMREDFYLESTSREPPGVGFFRRRDSQTSSHSLDSITANSPTSRDAMDLGFSDSEICESSSTQETGLSSSYFHEERKEEDDICQSTSDEPDLCSQVDSSNDNISSTTSLSWQIVKDKNSEVDDDDEAAVSGGRFSSSPPHSNENQALSCSISCSQSADWSEDTVSATVTLSINTDTNDSFSPAGLGNFGDNEADNASTVVDKNSGRSTDVMETDDQEKSSGSRSCPSPVSFACQPSQTQTDVLAQAASRLSSDDPGSYFLQATQFDSLGPMCQAAPDHTNEMVETSCAEEDPPIMGSDSHCMAGSWSGFVPLSEDSSHVDDQDPSRSTNVNTISTSANLNTELKGEASQPNVPAVTTDQWRPCAICLEDLPCSQLLTHIHCDGIFCQNCLDMSVKHTADVSAYCCPICLQPANICEDFIQLPSSSNDTKLNTRMLSVCITYRHCVIDNSGASSLQLVGHPNILRLPSVISGEMLYTLVDRLLARPVFTYSIMLTDGQGLSCSRCPYAAHCTGCEVPREGDVSLHPSDCLTVHSCEMLSPDEVMEMQHVYDDDSVEGLRSNEPTTLMDCFRGFTQSEILDEHNPWYCPQCKRNQCAKKTMTVWRYPDNLIIQLKRFVYQDLSSTKVDTNVTFPHRAMDVHGFLSGPSSSSLLYNLYSVICHFGGASSGHYTCFAKHPLTSQWNYYNDETVTPQTPAENEFSSAYVLFYQRQGTEVEFSPPQYTMNMEEIGINGRGNGSSSTAATSCMALVPFDPPITSSSSLAPSTSAKKSVDDNEEADDDYDYERRRSSYCEDDSLTVHFGTEFPELN